jgi:hypothetical protein
MRFAWRAAVGFLCSRRAVPVPLLVGDMACDQVGMRFANVRIWR